MSRRHGGDGDEEDEAGNAPPTVVCFSPEVPTQEEAPRSTRQRARALLFRAAVLPHVTRWLRGLAVPSWDRADVAGDVWLAAVESWPSFDATRARPERWLNRIAVHVASHYHGRARHRSEESLDALLYRLHRDQNAPWTTAGDVAACAGSRASDRSGKSLEELLCLFDPAPDAFTQVAREQDRLRFLEALQALDEKYCHVLVSHDIEGIPMVRIAESMGVPVSTLYKWRARALAALRDQLEEAELDGSV
jgi:RNA polymerase sigma-70 factor, ECF subfamily